MPTAFNFRAIDGIILLLYPSKGGNKKKKALLLPLQVTIAKSHSDSEKIFFNDWDKWVASLQDFDVDVEFLWVTDGDSSFKEIKEEYRWTRSGKVLKHPAYRSTNIPIKSVNPDIWNRFQHARSNAE